MKLCRHADRSCYLSGSVTAFVTLPLKIYHLEDVFAKSCMTENKLTPMLKQYQELKQQHPGTLLFFRLGDFYELFFDDAVTGARIMEITLTARQKERGTAIPMCGVPHHAISTYITRLIRHGYRVAICEQTEEATKGKKLVRREVVRVITPGTAIDPQLMTSDECVYLAALCGAGDNYGAAFLDLSTGEFCATEAHGPNAWAQIRTIIEAYAPRELLIPESLTTFIDDAYRDRADHAPQSLLPEKHPARHPPPHTLPARVPEQGGNGMADMALMPIDEWHWEPIACTSLLCEQFGVRTLESYGLQGRTDAVSAAGACLRYVRETQHSKTTHINSISFIAEQDCLVLDAATIHNLELVDPQSKNVGRDHTVFHVINSTMTGMGARLLRSWVLRPSIKRNELEMRLTAVGEFVGSQLMRDKIQSYLKNIADLDRLIGRINMNSATPRDFIALRRSLDQMPSIKQALSDTRAPLLQVLHEQTDELSDVRELIACSLSDEPPVNIAEGGTIRDGCSVELDTLRDISTNTKKFIAALEARERTRSGISSLRIRFNNVFGYFIEVAKGSVARVPADYERRQTLSTVERYTTGELKQLEQRVLGAEDQIKEIEVNLFAEVRTRVATETVRLQATARSLCQLDVLSALAETAVRRRYQRPSLHDGDEIKIIQGRHPVIEAFSAAPFVPNDIYMNNSTDRLLVITGPNMGGKSTVLRQVALIAILAQIGSYVPAESAHLPVFDRIWTRIGASDDLSRGRSTFMVEMIETAAILRSATPRSLVILDEIGRGTATFDGLSIAWAVAEYLHDSPQHAAKTLFATHYHELTELAERLPGAQNYQIRVSEREDEIIFLYRLERGRSSKSYGIEVARLAGLPLAVLTRARDVLERLERYELDVFAESATDVKSPLSNGNGFGRPTLVNNLGESAALQQAARRAGRRALAAQVTLFDAANQDVLDELRGAEVENLSLEQMQTLLRSVCERII